MANVEDVNLPYEILIRFGDDGLPKGAHAQYIRRISIDDEMIKEEIGNAEPLDLEGFPTSALMADTARDALAEVTRLNGQVESLKTELDTRTNSLDTANKRGEELTVALSEMTDRTKTAEATNQEMKSRIAELETSLSTMTDRAAAVETRVSRLLTALEAANVRIKELDPDGLIVFEPTDY